MLISNRLAKYAIAKQSVKIGVERYPWTLAIALRCPHLKWSHAQDSVSERFGVLSLKMWFALTGPARVHWAERLGNVVIFISHRAADKHIADALMVNLASWGVDQGHVGRSPVTLGDQRVDKGITQTLVRTITEARFFFSSIPGPRTTGHGICGS